MRLNEKREGTTDSTHLTSLVNAPMNVVQDSFFLLSLQFMALHLSVAMALI